MKLHTLLIGLPLFAIASAAAFAQTTGFDARARLAQAGYSEVRDLEFDDGLWEAEVRDADGRWHDVHLHEATGELLDDHSGQALLDVSRISSSLQSAGYTDVHGLELEDALWEADATNATGERVELRISAHTGAVLTEQRDD